MGIEHWVRMASALLLSTAGVATHALGLDETVGQLLHRDAQEAIAGKPILPPPPPRALPDVVMPPLSMPVPPPVLIAPPMVTAIYGTPGQLAVVLQIEGKRVVLDQRTGRADDASQPFRLIGVNGSCARIVLASRGTPTTLCVASGFGTARRVGGLQ
jgi:hypothetical protein